MAEKQTDSFSSDANERARAINGTFGDRVDTSWDLLVQSFDKGNTLTPPQLRRARRFGVTALVAAGAVLTAIIGVTVATSPKTPEFTGPSFATAEDYAALQNSQDTYGGDTEQVVGEFIVPQSGNATEGLDLFLEQHPEITVSEANKEYSQWSSLESGKMLNGVQPNETIQVTLDDINDDDELEVVLQRPLPPADPLDVEQQ